MKTVQILDCTLRDGGRIIDCKFEDKIISDMTKDLTLAGIDIVEMGFLRDEKLCQYQGNSTFFNTVSQMEAFIPKTSKKTIYVAFIDYNMYDFSKLEPCNGKTITGIRIGFTKTDFLKEAEAIKQAMLKVKQQGYRLFIQGVNTLGYSDQQLLEVINMVNEIEPYSFGLVDTYGGMYLEDIIHYYDLIDYNLNSKICIDIHSHNNFQSSFAFAQEIVRIANGRRNIILDSTLNGVGKCAGNLNTELLADYLTRKKNCDYDVDIILDAIDKFLVPLQKKYSWGYSIPAFMAGIYKAHPNNIIYLTEKYRLSSKDIKYIISGIDEDTRQKYDYDNIQRIYRKYNESSIDDLVTVQRLNEVFIGKKVLILVPGKTIDEYLQNIFDYIAKENPLVISVNFIPEKIECDYHFYANTIHWERVCDDVEHAKCILTSNIHENTKGVSLLNYSSLIVEDSKLYDNSTIMLLNFLNKVDVDKICIAGFDGLKKEGHNYIADVFPDSYDEKNIEFINKEVKKLYEQFKAKVAGKVEVEILTPSIYER